MYKISLYLLFSLFISCSSGMFFKNNKKEQSWVSLSNVTGQSLWSRYGNNTEKLNDFWVFENGVLTCNTSGDRDHSGSWFLLEKELRDFEFKFKFRYDKNLGGNSGLQVRSRLDLENNKMQGPQIDIHPPKPFRTGLIYGETTGVNHWLFPVTDTWKLASYDTPKDFVMYTDGIRWNEMYVKCEGTKIMTKINNVTIADFDGKGVLDDTLHKKLGVGLSGKIAFQLHKKHDVYIQFRDIYLKKFLND
jgi:hypothetical protein